MSPTETLQEACLRMLAEPADSIGNEDDDIDLSPPPVIDPQRLEAISELQSLQDAAHLYRDIELNIALIDGREEVAERARRLELLKLANGAKRCEHLKLDGEGCGSPAVRGHLFCYFHDQLYQAQPCVLPVVEDQKSLQLALHRLAQQVNTETINPAKAKLLLQILLSAAKSIPAELPN